MIAGSSTRISFFSLKLIGYDDHQEADRDRCVVRVLFSFCTINRCADESAMRCHHNLILSLASVSTYGKWKYNMAATLERNVPVR
jgi:hypothetical protein